MTTEQFNKIIESKMENAPEWMTPQEKYEWAVKQAEDGLDYDPL